MLKYSIELKNLDNEEIAKTDVGEVEEDYASNPQVVALLPVIQNLSSAVESEDPLVYKYFHEVEYGSDEWKNSLAPTFKHRKHSMTHRQFGHGMLKIKTAMLLAKTNVRYLQYQ